MKTKNVILLSASVLIMGAVAAILLKKKKVYDRLSEVADEGYELAHDVLYPLKNQRKKLRGSFNV